MSQKDKPQDLRIASPCEASWEGMRSDGADRRYCKQCDRHVHDFAQLTPREISGLLRASGGRLCARLTHDAEGRLVTLPARALPPRPAPSRAPQLAAAAVLSLLGLGGAACADPAIAFPAEARDGATALAGAPGALGSNTAPHPVRRIGGPRAALHGTVTREGGGAPLAEAEVRIVNLFDREERSARTGPDGAFSFPSLRPGLYRVEAAVRGWTAVEASDVVIAAGQEKQVGLAVPAAVWERLAADRPLYTSLAGAIMLTAAPLRQVAEESSLTVTATIGRSVPVPDDSERPGQIRTELLVSEVLQGETAERIVHVLHTARPELHPGEAVLAFLVPGERGDRRRGGYLPADHGFGLKPLREADLAAYAERIRELAAVTSRDPSPEPLVEWLVATAEDPATRHEAVRELGNLAARRADQGTAHPREVRNALADFLAAGGTLADDLDPAVLAAFLTEGQKARLTEALLRTDRLAHADVELYRIVRPWSGDDVRDWLLARIADPAAGLWESRTAMRLIADELGDQGLAALLDNTTDDKVKAAFQEVLTRRAVN